MLRLHCARFSSLRSRGCPSTLSFHRFYSTSEPIKPSLQLVAELRKRTEVSISKAREALVATSNDLDAALEWVQNDLAVSGAKKAEKVSGRKTKEGLIGVSVLAPGYGNGTGTLRAAMIELNCETDFVGRNELFGKLVSDIAHSTAFHSQEAVDFEENPVLLRQFPPEVLLDAPLIPRDQLDPSFAQSLAMPSSISSAIRDTIAKVGENISLRRAVSVVLPPAPEAVEAGVRVASYVHGSTSDPSCGRIATLALTYLKSPHIKKLFEDEAFREEYAKLERALARQIVGFNARSIRLVRESPEATLYEQPFVLFPGDFSNLPVKAALQAWAMQNGLIDKSAQDEFQGMAVTEFVRWSVGEEDSPSGGVSSLESEMTTAGADSDSESSRSTSN